MDVEAVCRSRPSRKPSLAKAAGGVGQALAHALAEQGADLLLARRNGERLAILVAEIGGIGGTGRIAIRLHAEELPKRPYGSTPLGLIRMASKPTILPSSNITIRFSPSRHRVHSRELADSGRLQAMQALIAKSNKNME